MIRFAFTGGGYVLHKFKGCSAWFDPAGALIDAERIDTQGRSYSVRKNSPKWQELETVGKAYAPKAAA